MTTEIEAKLREIQQDKFVSYAQRDRLGQALRRALECISLVSYGLPETTAETFADIEAILSAPNDKEGE